MKRISLLWDNPYSVADLLENFKKSASVSNDLKKYPSLNGYGFYMYLDMDQCHVRYIGQAFDKSSHALRNRIRWEILKDGNNCALSAFSSKCQKLGINKLSLILKVAHIKEATDNGNQIKRNPTLMNDIEMALICVMKKHPLMNEHGKMRYRRESIEIFNSGNSAPLPEAIKKIMGESC